MVTDSVISWGILMVCFYIGIARFLLAIEREKKRNAAEADAYWNYRR